MHRSTVLLWIVVGIQSVCASFFLWDMLVTLLGIAIKPLNWKLRELLEISASIGLILGAVLGLRMVLITRKHHAEAQKTIRSLSGALAEVLEEHFTEWKLTESEREVAWLTVKGFSNCEIAELRGTREGTIKAQSYAIFRKADVSGRTQLLALIVDDMMHAVDVPSPG